MSRFARAVDGNQSDTVEALRAIGVKVDPLLARIGNGRPDLLCGVHGRFFIIEQKMPGESLTPAEKNWHEEWAGFPVFVVSSSEAALRIALNFRRRNPRQE